MWDIIGDEVNKVCERGSEQGWEEVRRKDGRAWGECVEGVAFVGVYHKGGQHPSSLEPFA
jgi:hypothetical protein